MTLGRLVESGIVGGIAPVAVLEGARAVGKTVVGQRLVAAGHYQGYENLADPLTRAIAAADLPGWLASLPDRVVIDEAQLLPDLPLYVKFIVDQPDSTRRFLLTGSAAIGRTGLGGSDPLTGRVARHRLWPFTKAEAIGRPQHSITVIDDLLSGAITSTREYPPFNISELISTGGFPQLALTQHATGDSDRWVRDTTLGLLTDDVLPNDRYDLGTAGRVLDACLREPGAIVNLNSLAQRLTSDPRTVDRYLDILERRFLVHFLPNLALNPVRQTRTRAKIHPTDTAFAMESIRRANPITGGEPTHEGKVWESWIVQQILPGLPYQRGSVNAFFWRDSGIDKNKPHSQRFNEVDLVLIDGTGHTVGIEVKRCSRVSIDDAGGLFALRKQARLDFGYVIYGGTTTLRLSDGIYALPASALWK
ncbi:MAG: AAA family ATPase [Cellulomonadaceae bacterium]|jgi:predicted AAA+ superfamily ATPase|nr:AAA family ATPase [Cellulomonadaceae bacterium]